MEITDDLRSTLDHQLHDAVVAQMFEQAIDRPVPGQTGLDPGVGHRRAEHHPEWILRRWSALWRVPIADRERRVVAAHRAGPHEDCIALGTESMGVGAGFRSGDPLRSAVGRCRPAIEAGGKLGDHEWTTRSSMVEVRGKLLGDKIGTDADGDLNPRRLERADALAGDVTVGITDPDDDPSNAGLDEGVTARTGATGVITRLECGVERRTAYRVGAGGIERDSLRVAAAGRFGGAVEDLPVEGDDNGANPGVG